jgi:hypothetical protein
VGKALARAVASHISIVQYSSNWIPWTLCVTQKKKQC